MSSNEFFKEGRLEVYCGPMKCGKSREMLARVDRFPYVGAPFLFFKPSTDTRDSVVKSRFAKIQFECEFVNSGKPKEILDALGRKDFNHGVVLIDEAQFFGRKIVDVVNLLVLRKYHVILGGLDLDFRGKPFGPMPFLLARADEVHKLVGVCEYDKCNMPATRTQRLIGGKPAHYDSPIVSVEGKENEVYQCRCLQHHVVLGRPKFC